MQLPESFKFLKEPAVPPMECYIRLLNLLPQLVRVDLRHVVRVDVLFNMKHLDRKNREDEEFFLGISLGVYHVLRDARGQPDQRVFPRL